MRHRVDHRKLGMKTEHRLAVLRNLLTSLIISESIKTTVARAKELRRFAEKMITYGKGGTLHHKRLAMRYLRSREALKKLFDELAKRYKDRNGGYTRITRLGFRKGDGAELSIIELIGRPPKEKKAKVAEKGVEEVTPPKVEKEEKKEAPKEEKKRSWFWWRKKEE
jgi:large subunit ribosomal protein L17